MPQAGRDWGPGASAAMFNTRSNTYCIDGYMLAWTCVSRSRHRYGTAMPRTCSASAVLRMAMGKAGVWECVGVCVADVSPWRQGEASCAGDAMRCDALHCMGAGDRTGATARLDEG